jgi:hypothetical protein
MATSDDGPYFQGLLMQLIANQAGYRACHDGPATPESVPGFRN